MEPDTIDMTIDEEEAFLRQQRDDLGAAIRRIAADLAERDKRDVRGRRLSAIEWHTWRQSALVAQRHKIDELQVVKRRLHEIQQAKDAAKREQTKASDGNGVSLDWKPAVMRALDESQRERDQLLTMIRDAVTLLATSKSGTKAAQARDLLNQAVGIVEH
jgi:hypothetical protein